MLAMIVEKKDDGPVQYPVTFETGNQGSKGVVEPQQVLLVPSFHTCFPDPIRKGVPGRKDPGRPLQYSPWGNGRIRIP